MTMKQTIVLFFSLFILYGQISFAASACSDYFSMPDEVIDSCTYQIQSGHLISSHLAIAYTNRAEALNEKSEFDKAIHDCNLALNEQPDYYEAFQARGLAWQGKKDYDKAIAEYTTAIKRINNNEQAHEHWRNQLAILYMRRASAWGLKGELDKSIIDSSEAIRLNPEAARAYYNRGLAWLLKGEPDKAVDDYNEAIQLNPADPKAWLTINREFIALSKEEQATRLYKDLTFSGIFSISPTISRVFNTQETRYGKVLIVSKRADGYEPASIMYDGKTILTMKSMYISFHSKYSIGNKDILLYKVSCGGSACGPDTLFFLVVDDNRYATTIFAEDFYSNDGIVNPVMEDNQIIIDLGFEKNRKKVAVFDSGELIIKHILVQTEPMSQKRCEWLYRYAYIECLSFKKYNKCEEYGRHHTGACVATMTGLSSISNHPGFVPTAWGEVCVNSCNTGKLLPFEEFKEKVCSIQ